MTLDLDELERKAKVALSYDPDPGEYPWFQGRLHPDAVLALIERVRELEQRVEASADAALERDMRADT